MGYQHRNFHFGQKGYPLKQRNSPISKVIENDWFEFAPPPPVLKIAFRGSGGYHGYILNKIPTLPLDVVIRLGFAAKYAQSVTGNSATDTLDVFLENSDSIWDLRNYGFQWRNVAVTTPVTADGQVVRVVKPFTNANNLIITGASTPAVSNAASGLVFLNSPTSEYRLSTLVTAKTIIFSTTPIAYVSSGDATMDYPFPLAVWDSDIADFHVGIINETTYFASFWGSKIYNTNLWLNGVSTTGANLLKQYTRHMLTVQQKTTETFQFNSVSGDRINLRPDLDRHFSGSYGFIFASANTYSALRTNALNAFCMAYLGLT